MAFSLRFQFLVLLLLLLLTSLFTSAASATYADGGATPPFSASEFQTAPPPPQSYPPALFATILSTLGLQELSTATASANLSATTPVTIFAPSDASLLTCTSCSLPLLLQELSIPGLYSLNFLKTLMFGTKIETLEQNRCLTVTADEKKEVVFVNGVQITSPNLFNNGVVVIHGLRGLVSHLSPLSCNVQWMTSLSGSSPPPPHSMMRLMLKDALTHLKGAGYEALSIALRVKFVELSELKALTIFVLDDAAIFSGEGYSYLSNFWSHMIPNRSLTAAELVSLPPTTSLPTMDAGNNLVVTTEGCGGPLAPMNKVLVNGGVITPLPFFNDGIIVVYALQVSDLSCNVERMAWLSFPTLSAAVSSAAAPPPRSIMQFLKLISAHVQQKLESWSHHREAAESGLGRSVEPGLTDGSESEMVPRVAEAGVYDGSEPEIVPHQGSEPEIVPHQSPVVPETEVARGVGQARDVGERAAQSDELHYEPLDSHATAHWTNFPTNEAMREQLAEYGYHVREERRFRVGPFELVRNPYPIRRGFLGFLSVWIPRYCPRYPVCTEVLRGSPTEMSSHISHCEGGPAGESTTAVWNSTYSRLNRAPSQCPHYRRGLYMHPARRVDHVAMCQARKTDTAAPEGQGLLDKIRKRLGGGRN